MAPHEIPGYRLSLPSRQDVILALTHVLDAQSAEQLWCEACKSLGLQADLVQIDIDELRWLANWLIARDSLARIVGHSLRVRVLSFRQLNAVLQDEGNQHAK